MIARVIVPLPIDKAFDYKIPDSLDSEIQVGSRVLVPFGRQLLTGVICSLSSDAHTQHTLKSIRDVLDSTPSMTPELMELTRWMADYYMCSWGEVIRAALPSGIDVQQHYLVRYAPSGPPLPLDKGVNAHTLKLIRAHSGCSLKELRKLDRSVTLSLLRRLQRAGHVELELALKKPKVSIKKEKRVTFTGGIPDEGSYQDMISQLSGEKQQALMNTLYELTSEKDSIHPLSVLLQRTGASTSTARSLERKGIISITEHEVIRTPFGTMPAYPEKALVHTLHSAQENALNQIGGAIENEKFETFLLHGVTGSGKTEVYIAALKRALERRKTGIVLVPEIALTPQTVTRFRAHFGDQVAVMHSRMSLGERYDAWRKLREGKFPIVIGPRSAILAPLSDIGVIIVDEEHESSYKQFDPAPRYHARDVAVMRASMNQAVCILGSATPSMESYHNATQSRKYRYLAMPERVPVPGRRAASLPVVTAVDLIQEKKKRRLPGVLSEPLKQAISLRLSRNEQVILLQNRRGYSAILLCQTCGWSPMCDDCAVTLTYHKAKHNLRCHYCGKTAPFMRRCKECGSTDMARMGVGTQRVEEELEAHFPQARTLRMDLDTTTEKNAHYTILDQFGRGQADILIGTQMVAKGLDFARVTLVGVINADVGMLLPDFRADERTFQLLTQVAGRAGRADRPGEVLLQTRNPDSPVLRFAMQHEFESFARDTLLQRKELGYPPFGRLIRIEFKGPEERTVEEISEKWTKALQGHEAVQILGPQPTLVSRVQKMYRFHTILKASRSFPPDKLRTMITAATQRTGNLPKQYRMLVDVDALSLY